MGARINKNSQTKWTRLTSWQAEHACAVTSICNVTVNIRLWMAQLRRNVKDAGPVQHCTNFMLTFFKRDPAQCWSICWSPSKHETLSMCWFNVGSADGGLTFTFTTLKYFRINHGDLTWINVLLSSSRFKYLCYVSTAVIFIFHCGDRLYTSESDV